MEGNWKDKLIRNFKSLVHNTQLYRVVDECFSKEVITAEDRERILSLQIDNDRNRLFIKVLLHQSQIKFERFMECLTDEFVWIKEMIEEDKIDKVPLTPGPEYPDIRRKIFQNYNEIVKNTTIYVLSDDLISDKILEISDWESMSSKSTTEAKNRLMLDALIRSRSHGYCLLMNMLEHQGYYDLVSKIKQTVVNESTDKDIEAYLRNEGDYREKTSYEILALRLIEQHCHDEMFVETPVVGQGLEILEEHGLLIYVGLPGDGKTKNAVAVMNYFQKKYPSYLFLIICDVKSFPSCVNPERKTFVFLDDFWRFNVSNDDANIEGRNTLYWATIQSYVRKGNCKIIMTLRNTELARNKEILKQTKIYDKKWTIDLTSSKWKLTKEYKRQILVRYFEKNNIVICRKKCDENYKTGAKIKGCNIGNIGCMATEQKDSSGYKSAAKTDSPVTKSAAKTDSEGCKSCAKTNSPGYKSAAKADSPDKKPAAKTDSPENKSSAKIQSQGHYTDSRKDMPGLEFRYKYATDKEIPEISTVTNNDITGYKCFVTKDNTGSKAADIKDTLQQIAAIKDYPKYRTNVNKETTGFQIRISEKTVNKICDTNSVIGFPQSCYMFCTKKSYTSLGLKYFKKPSKKLIKQIAKMGDMEATKGQKLQYCIMAYMLLNGGSINLENIDDGDDLFDKVVRSVGLQCDRDYRNRDIPVKIGALTDVYICLDENSESFIFKHQTVLESVAICFYEDNGELLLRHCSKAFIKEFVRPKSFKEQKGEIVLKVKEKHYNIIVERFLVGSDNGMNKFKWWVGHPLFEHEKFVDNFCLLVQDNEIYHTLIQRCVKDGLFSCIDLFCQSYFAKQLRKFIDVTDNNKHREKEKLRPTRSVSEENSNTVSNFDSDYSKTVDHLYSKCHKSKNVAEEYKNVKVSDLQRTCYF